MRVSVAIVVLSATIQGARAEEATYAAIYYQAGEQITLTAQPTPIPVPQVGSVIEVSDQGRQLAGYVRSVSHDIRRSSGPFPVRFYIVKVEISPSPPASTGARAFRR